MKTEVRIAFVVGEPRSRSLLLKIEKTFLVNNFSLLSL